MLIHVSIIILLKYTVTNKKKQIKKYIFIFSSSNLYSIQVLTSFLLGRWSGSSALATAITNSKKTNNFSIHKTN